MKAYKSVEFSPRKTRFKNITTYLLAAATVYSLLFSLSGQFRGSRIMGVTALSLLLLLIWGLWLAKRERRLTLVIHLVLMATGLALAVQAYNGAMMNDSAWFLCFLPLLASYQLGTRASVAWGAVGIGLVVLFSFASIQFAPPPEHVLSFQEITRNRVVFILLITAFATSARRAEDLMLHRAQAGETRLESIFNGSSEGLLVVDDQGTIEEANPAAERIFGYSEKGSLVGLSLCALVPDLHDSPGSQLSGSSERRWARTSGLTRQGEEIPISLSLSEVRLKDRCLYSGIMSDISEQVEVSEKLTRAKEQAEAANLAKSEFLASMSHELRTPLNSIIGFSEMMVDEVAGPVTKKQAKYLHNVLQNGRHLLGMVNDVLDLAKVEAGQAELKVERFELGELLGESVDLSRSIIEEKKLQVVQDLPQPVEFSGDRVKVRQIFLNLLGNAIKFTPAEGSLRIVLTQEAREALVIIEDSGIGIESEDLERIFKRFEQADGRYSREYQGTGLGLSLSRSLVRLHGGRIWAESEGLGKGSRFLVALPLETRYS